MYQGRALHLAEGRRTRYSYTDGEQWLTTEDIWDLADGTIPFDGTREHAEAIINTIEKG